MSLSHFDERSGVVDVQTEWGRWWQCISDVSIEVNIPPGTRGKDCKVSIRPNYIECYVLEKLIFKGALYKTVRPESSSWTVEDRKLLVILLEKAEKFNDGNSWVSLLEDEYVANPYLQVEMLKKLDLEKFQIENPGFDFSGAKLSKNYENIPNVADK